MPWTWEEIQTDWLGGGPLDMAPDEAVAAFERVERTFGREWLDKSALFPGWVDAQGLTVAFSIITPGLLLGVLDDVRVTERLMTRLRARDREAWAELLGLYVVCIGTQGLRVESEPPVTVGGRIREPDWRIKRATGPWTYAEVTQAQTSDDEGRLRGLFQRLASHIDEVQPPFELEVFLEREPTEEELPELEKRIVSMARSGRSQQEPLPDDLGLLFLTPARRMLPSDDHGEPSTSRIFMSTTRKNASGEARLLVRFEFADPRADNFLRQKARQLPTNDRGLVLIDVTGAPGAMNEWESLIEGRLQPGLHTRVGAVCLITAPIWTSARGPKWRPETKLILNEHAKLRLPDWMVESLRRWESS